MRVLKLLTILICSIVLKNLSSKMHVKAFLYILRKILTEKYSDVEFDFYLSSRSKNVHVGLNCNIMSLPEHVNIISDIENIWIEKRQDTQFKFVMSYLLHTTKWKYDYIVFSKNNK